MRNGVLGILGTILLEYNDIYVDYGPLFTKGAGLKNYRFSNTGVMLCLEMFGFFIKIHVSSHNAGLIQYKVVHKMVWYVYMFYLYYIYVIGAYTQT